MSYAHYEAKNSISERKYVCPPREMRSIKMMPPTEKMRQFLDGKKTHKRKEKSYF